MKKRETKKVPVSFSPNDQDSIQEIAKLLGIHDTYGDLPKAIKFSINLTLSALKNPEKVYTGLNDEQLDHYFSAIKSGEILSRNMIKKREIEQNPLKSITS